MTIKERARMTALDIFPVGGRFREQRTRAYMIILKALQEQQKDDLKCSSPNQEINDSDETLASALQSIENIKD